MLYLVLQEERTMKIKLDPPYSADWRHGYIQTNPEGRKTVILYNSNQDRSSTSYARYLMSVKVGRYLNADEHVDHVDDDKSNDDISNLQILTPKENNRKECLRRGASQAMVRIRCPECESIFEKRRGLTQLVKCYRGKVTCCSRKCSSELRKKKMSRDDRLRISEEQVIEEFGRVAQW